MISNNGALGFFEQVAPNKKNMMSSNMRSVPDIKIEEQAKHQ